MQPSPAQNLNTGADGGCKVDPDAAPDVLPAVVLLLRKVSIARRYGNSWKLAAAQNCFSLGNKRPEISSDLSCIFFFIGHHDRCS
ncbi:hypothetical protein A2U01_0068765, partial [Trifolium medium]|nr:hypothetical protein [Trifolium medium]